MRYWRWAVGWIAHTGRAALGNIAAADSNRRTLYGYVDRRMLPGLYRTFDFPSPDASSPSRDVTTVPQQALFLMNHPLVLTAAQNVLARPEIAAVTEQTERTALLYRLLYARSPETDELLLARDFLGHRQPLLLGPNSLKDYC